MWPAVLHWCSLQHPCCKIPQKLPLMPVCPTPRNICQQQEAWFKPLRSFHASQSCCNYQASSLHLRSSHRWAL
jgi:hypothetical protein